VWVVVTGGLHLDGWTDCCDALPTALPPERRYEILKDPRLGTFGALGLMILLAVKVGALARDDVSAATVFLAPVVGRAVMVLVAYGARHGGAGMAAAVISGVDRTTVWRAAAIGFVPVLLAGWVGVLGAAAAYFGARWFRNLAEARLPAVNGDVLGAACELSEAVFLLIASMR
jgi:adenosylcobinamide-GDP ribazoletransferase